MYVCILFILKVRSYLHLLVILYKLLKLIINSYCKSYFKTLFCKWSNNVFSGMQLFIDVSGLIYKKYISCYYIVEYSVVHIMFVT